MHTCSFCGGVTGFVGKLRDRYHYECRNCGVRISSLTALVEEEDGQDEQDSQDTKKETPDGQ